MARGQLNGAGTAVETPIQNAARPAAQLWTGLDHPGNWTEFAQTIGATTAAQTRTPNDMNQYTAIDFDGPGGASPLVPTHDDAGNMSFDPSAVDTCGDQGLKYEYDEENRLTKVSRANDTILMEINYDALGRRTAIDSASPLPPWYGSDVNTYNRRNELITCARSAGTATVWDYDYDFIGNRLWNKSGPDLQNLTTNLKYLANTLNQYTETRHAQTNAQIEAFQHDFDGNLKQDGTFNYIWDAENRLVGVDPVTPTVSGVRVRFDYDYLGRRVRKQVFTGGWLNLPINIMLDRRFIYDGWNLLEELDGLANNNVVRKYTWGLDLAGQNGNPSVAGMHGAGGIGGLLAMVDPNIIFGGDPEPENGMVSVIGSEGGMSQLGQIGAITSQPAGGVVIDYENASGAIAQVAIDDVNNPQTGGTLSMLDSTGHITTMDLLDAQTVEGETKLLFGDPEGGVALASAPIIIIPGGSIQKVYWYFYDANGNVTQLFDGTDGSLEAHYEYDPYGKPEVMFGPIALSNTMRFSTKYWDGESALGYWGRRYYAPASGRWMSRDPLGENRASNLMAYTTNNPIDRFDLLGLEVPIGRCRCGEDISDQFDKFFTRFDVEFAKAGDVNQDKACWGMYSTRGWDITELWQAGGGIDHGQIHDPFANGQCGSGACRGSVTIHGRCYWAREVNYILWGKANERCYEKHKDRDGDNHFTLDEANYWVAVYRWSQILNWWSGYGESGPRVEAHQAFVYAGYKNGDLSQARDYQVENCIPCKLKHSTPIVVRVGADNALLFGVAP